MEADLVKREGVRFEAIPAAGLHGVGIRALPGNIWQMGHGFFSSQRILRGFRPDVLLFTGGYVAVPMALAARLSRRAKSLLYVPDIEPGLALKTIARFADRIALTVDESKAFFPKHPGLTVTGYPLRSTLDQWTKADARRIFALREELPVLLVFGGSKGARSINQALTNALPGLLKDMQVIHISGKLDWQMVEQARAGLSSEQQNRYRVYPYLYKEMGAAMRMADLALTRAGASSLGELPLFGLPAIVVPYPHAWRYQRVNASYLIKHGAAELLEDAELSEQLVPKVRALMADRERREKMSQAMRSLAKPEAATTIAALLKEMAGDVQQSSPQPVLRPPD
jgi:UDP-N-acetylglucosamine--N-acetylmuramyl-(pentapeptide) pyrophosphoryl-undecaprenol N-acetylglucosamine transferase